MKKIATFLGLVVCIMVASCEYKGVCEKWCEKYHECFDDPNFAGVSSCTSSCDADDSDWKHCVMWCDTGASCEEWEKCMKDNCSDKDAGR